MGRARILYFSAWFIGLAQLASAVNFDQCLASVNNMTIDGKMDNHGRPLPPSTNNATAITYDLCVSQCGADSEPIQWAVFSQQFASWILPWLALVSQLPFGANDKKHNLMSVLLALGSPTLAAYSLALTAFNGRWIAERYRGYHYANAVDVGHVLHSLQQSPLRIDQDGALLASLGNLWLWLLAIVVGWLHLSPRCDSKLLKEAVANANTNVYVATTDSPVLVVRQKHAITLDFSTADDARLDECITAPIYNYARFLPWVQAVTALTDKFDNICDRNGHDEEIVEGKTLFDRKSGGWEQLTAEQVNNYCLLRHQKWFPRDWRLDHSVWLRMGSASFCALVLQWGTTGAAIFIAWFTPTIGLGCRSLSYLIYGGASTLAWMMLLLSSVLTFYSTNTPARACPGCPLNLRTRSVRCVAIWLRHFGKLIAVLNAFVLLVASILQLSGIYNRCYCNSSVFGLGRAAYTVISLTSGDMANMMKFWGAGVVSGGLLAAFFSVCIALHVPT